MLGANRLYVARTFVWTLHTTAQCSLASAVIYMLSHSQVDGEVVDPPQVLLSVPDVYDVDLDAKDKWDMPGKPPSVEIGVCSRLQADFAVVCDQCAQYSIEAPTTAVGVFKLALRGLNTLCEQRGLVGAVDPLCSIIQSSKVQKESFQC